MNLRHTYFNRQTSMLTTLTAPVQHFHFGWDRGNRISCKSQQLLKNYFSYHLPSETRGSKICQQKVFSFQNSHYIVLTQILAWLNWQESTYFVLKFWEESRLQQLGRYLKLSCQIEKVLLVLMSSHIKIEIHSMHIQYIRLLFSFLCLVLRAPVLFFYVLWNRMT